MKNATGLLVGFIPLARTTFDIPLAKEVTALARSALADAGLTLVGPESLVTSLEEASAAAEDLAEHSLDLLVVFQATFADSTMVLSLAQAVNAPLLLWAAPEAPSGGRLRLNSFCGINLGAHALARRGRRYDYLYAPAKDAQAVQQVHLFARADYAYRLLRGVDFPLRHVESWIHHHSVRPTRAVSHQARNKPSLPRMASRAVVRSISLMPLT
jgi:hypothetical protein